MRTKERPGENLAADNTEVILRVGEKGFPYTAKFPLGVYTVGVEARQSLHNKRAKGLILQKYY
jgi:hypothetical protein